MYDSFVLNNAQCSQFNSIKLSALNFFFRKKINRYR